ncbi:GlsB/YeaQ/YmgE family stress response membrane protein [Actinomadura parmotrematis]|uniref:GlsB/YeaQ/YmgE family stress response membrane protein n=1 Tax=Actinomadura parmotrematis TaxID=2864039 RepID=A0ABS7FLQ3_9ACTN|nr:GlsB/YeaQ/YmgE family stress response membrane protein [Actinomadura parmotrematis]MBW8481307.1 GlsB/YeaQ/YmgE family stress response membrane protein [Actinomadura parmotrematis]
MVLTILYFIVVGAIVGALARLVVPGRNPMGILATILVGIVGAILGGLVAHAIGVGTVLALIISVVIAAVGVALLTGYQTKGRGRRSFR